MAADITATGENCCNYGDRIPGVWFYPGSHRLHIVHGHRDSGNDDCSPEEELPANRNTHVQIDILQKHVEVQSFDLLCCTILCWVRVGSAQPACILCCGSCAAARIQVFYNGRSRCTEPRGTTETFNGAHLYLADNWHLPALATVSNLVSSAIHLQYICRRNQVATERGTSLWCDR